MPPPTLLDENHGVRISRPSKNQPVDAFITAEDAEPGMAKMSEKFKEKGGEIYLPAASEHI